MDVSTATANPTTPTPATENAALPDTPPALLNTLLDAIRLDDSDRRSLRSRRGLTDESIDALKFRSGGDPVRHALLGIRDGGQWPAAQLLDSGLFVGGDEAVAPNPIYLKPNILIPYLDERDDCIAVRPHKNGPKGHPVRIYAPGFASMPMSRDVVMVEGEFGAAALRQVGFRAISVPGVSSFAGKNFPRLVAWLRARDVRELVVLFDREDKADPAKSGYKSDTLKRYDTEYWAWRVAHDLGRHDIDARIGTFPLEWDSNAAKVDADSALAAGKSWEQYLGVVRAGATPSEYLRMRHHTDEARRVLSLKMANHLLLDKRRVVDDETYERGYRIRAAGVCREDFEERPKVGIRRKTPVRVSHAPIWLSGHGFDVETRSHYVELSYVRAQDGVSVMESELVERGAAMSARRLVEYAGVGLPVSSSSSSRLVEYLGALEATMAPHLPTARFTDRNGWHRPDGDRQYVLAAENIAPSDRPPRHPVRQYPRSHSEEKAILDGICRRGTERAWIELAAEAREASDLARFLLAAGFAAPLLYPVGARSFGGHIYGDSGGGKTAVAKLVSSIFGDPSRLIGSLFTTLVGVERRAALFCDLPIVLDELQMNADPKMRRTLAYLIAQEAGKTRGAKEGGLQHTPRWRVVSFTTGEEPLTTLDDFGGQAARVLELSGRPIPDDATARRIHELTRERHGHGGRIFVHALVDLDPEELRELLAVAVARLRRHMPDTRPATVTALATVCLADALASEWVFGASESRDDLLDASLTMGRDLWERQPANTPYGPRALDWARSWLVSNRRRFAREAEIGAGTRDIPTEREVWGKIAADGSVYILHNVWDVEVEKAGYNPTRVLQDWRDRGWIVTDGRNLKPKRAIEGRTARVVCVKPDAIGVAAE